MASTDVPLWSASLQKEALDLLVAVWPKLDEAGRQQLVAGILRGPPEREDTSGQNDVQQRQRWHDRAVFERLALLDRLGEPKLPKEGGDRLAALKRQYPNWDVAEGDRAHFTAWMESLHGHESDYGVDDLKRLSGAALLRILREPGPFREGRLDVWSRVAGSRPGRAIGVLRAIAATPAETDAEIWRETLFGVRNAISRRAVARRVFAVLASAPDRLLQNVELLSPASDLVERASEGEALIVDEHLFWRLWDRLLEGAVQGQGTPEPEHDDWLHLALNRPMGDLATALLNVMFRRGLRPEGGIPDDLRPRIDRFVAARPVELRLGRVILASRLVYLFAIDRAWTVERLLPYFDWSRSEDEAVALWRGYTWHARINIDLWGELRSYFLDAFLPARMERLGDSADTLASLLMVVGIELASVEIPADRVRQAIRNMTPHVRESAVTWLLSHLEGPKIKNPPPDAEIERAARADRLWRERISPWLTRVWPRDRNLSEPGSSVKFALLAIATDQAFNDAVSTLLPFICGSPQWGFAIHRLNESAHPDIRPEMSLALVGRLVVLRGPLFTSDLRTVLNRIGEADPSLRQDAAFRTLHSSLLAAGH